MEFHTHAKDETTGYDYMANSGQEETDRDNVGIVLALAVMAFLTICQYFKLY